MPDSPNKPYDVRDIIARLVDSSDFFEVQPSYAKNIVTGFARLAGRSIGIIANQPQYLAGVLDINASDKASRFIRFCDAFNMPLLTLADTAGYLPGVGQEHGGVIRHGAKLLYAYSEASVPKLTVILRKAYGGAYIAMCSRHLGADQVFAWPTAEIAVMGPEGAANIIFKKEIEEAPDPAAARKDKIEEYKRSFANPYKAAARGYVDDVIDPAHTRMRLCNALNMLLGKRQSMPSRKHGNIPV
jgi:Acetyl-CoA carboxylase, carboxyltransferase component (subunits alpha and beta)